MSIPDGIDAELNLSFTSQCAKALRLIVHMDVGSNAKSQSNMVCRYARKKSKQALRDFRFVDAFLFPHYYETYRYRHIEGKNSGTLFQEEITLVCRPAYDRNHGRFQDIGTKCRRLNSVLSHIIKVGLMHTK